MDGGRWPRALQITLAGKLKSEERTSAITIMSSCAFVIRTCPPHRPVCYKFSIYICVVRRTVSHFLLLLCVYQLSWTSTFRGRLELTKCLEVRQEVLYLLYLATIRVRVRAGSGYIVKYRLPDL